MHSGFTTRTQPGFSSAPSPIQRNTSLGLKAKGNTSCFTPSSQTTFLLKVLTSESQSGKAGHGKFEPMSMVVGETGRRSTRSTSLHLNSREMEMTTNPNTCFPLFCT